jgi:hypothetical protein
MSSDKKASRKPSITDEEALEFHRRGKPGKLEINPTKPMATQRDLSLAYSPGVAVPVRVIAENPDAAYDYGQAILSPLSPMVLPFWPWRLWRPCCQTGDGRHSCPFATAAPHSAA